METTAQTGNPATKRPRVDYTSRPNPSRSTRPIEEVSCSLASKVWAIACTQLDASVQTYFDVSFTLGAASQDPLRVFSPTLESSENIDDKIHRLDLNIQKLQQARVTLCLARTCNAKLAPINRLPREILSHIFELLVISEYWELSFGRNEHEEDGSTGSCQFKLPKQQYTLSQVCTHWQQVMTTPALWSRIDLVMSGKYQEVFYARASHFVSRAGNAPLIIQIHEPTHSSPSDIQRLTEWLAPVAGQIYSLDVSEGLATHEMVDSVLRTWLKHGTPGTVKELTLSANSGVHFIAPVPGPGSAQWEYIISSEGFENFFRPITMLRVSNVFPRWESHAYYGLTHLQLGDGSITEAQLVAVLFSSPLLCTLSFGLAITDADSFDTLKASV
ncbi:hypothetical protein FRC12_006247 [Ceratobasidium sp. 428]|nr:hypothetical protein FRC12_006247 [Ceratobasidium sp. 428]